jgi:hypothetical protein
MFASVISENAKCEQMHIGSKNSWISSRIYKRTFTAKIKMEKSPSI